LALTKAGKKATIPPPVADGFAAVSTFVNSWAEMDFRHRALILLLVLTTTAGCRQGAAQRELLERELRLQEDRIYELEAKLEDTQRMLERTGGKSATGEYCPTPGGSTLRDGMIIESSPNTFVPNSSVSPGSSSGEAPTRSPSALPSEIPNDTSPPKVELPMGMRNESAAPFAGMPVIIPPDPNKPEGLPSRGGLGGMLAELLPKEAMGISKPEPTIKEMSSPKFRSPTEGFRGDSPPPGTAGGSSRRGENPSAESGDVNIDPPSLPSDLNVASIGLHRNTGGWNNDGMPGDEGVFVLLEPRNQHGQVVPTIGAVSLVLIDPAIDGEGGRYARWDFTAQDSAALYRPAAAGSNAGLHFELAWPDVPPAHERMKLFVRFTTEDGRRLQAERDIKLQLGARAATDEVILEPVPLTTSKPESGGLSSARPAAAVGVEENLATPAVPQADATNTPLRWGGPNVSTKSQSATAATSGTDAHPSSSNLPRPALLEGPSLGPTLAPPLNGGTWRR
jgi:hypothetical protein